MFRKPWISSDQTHGSRRLEGIDHGQDGAKRSMKGPERGES